MDEQPPSSPTPTAARSGRSIPPATRGNFPRIARRIDAAGNATDLQYDAIGNLVRTTYPDGSTELATYDAENRVQSQTGRDGVTTTFTYDAAGRRTSTTHPDGSVTRNTYDTVGRVLTTADGRGNVTSYAYAANQQTVTSPTGSVVIHRQDGSGRRVSTIDALGRVTSRTFDSAGNTLRVTHPDNSTATTTYDLAKRRTGETDPAGRTTAFAYDAAGRLIRVTDAAGGVTTYTYDAAGNRATQTNASGRTIQMSYDAGGLMTTRTRPSGLRESFAHDAQGNIVSHASAAGQTASQSFDTAGRLVRRTVPGRSVTFGYSPGGRRLTAGGETFTYDAMGQLVHAQNAAGDVVQYQYDTTGNTTSVTTGAGTTRYTYDADNRLLTVADAAGITRHAYDAIGNLVSVQAPNGVSTSYDYDARDRLTRVTHTGPAGLLARYDYTLDAAGHRTQVIESGPATAGRTVTWVHDTLHRLVGETVTAPGQPTTTATYTLDAVGNRTRMDRGGGVTQFTYDADDRLISEAGPAGVTTSTYDGNGNLRTRTSPSGAQSFAYDADYRLVGASGAGGTAYFDYDADGMRVAATAGAQTTTFILDKRRELSRVLVERGAATMAYSHGHQLLNRTQAGGATAFYLADGGHSVRQLADASGGITDRYTYDAFGVPVETVGTTLNAYRYAGEPFDDTTGLYYLRARHYQPATGRLTSVDPHEGDLAQPITLHRYLYANANPVDLHDPSGRQATLLQISYAAAIGGSIGAATGIGGLAYKAKLGQPVTLADYGRAGVAGFISGAIGGGLVAAGSPYLALFGVATANWSNQMLLTHKARDVSISDATTQLAIQLIAAGAGFGAGQAFTNSMVRGMYAYIVGTYAGANVLNTVVNSAPPDDEILWRQTDRCPTGKVYKKHANGHYSELGSMPVAGCNLFGLAVGYYEYEYKKKVQSGAP